MDKAGIRFTGSRYIDIEFDPETKKAIIKATIDDTIIAGTVTLTAAKAAKMGDK